jgi:methylated-DNA-[protein]-cysteine S-methyltransferase
VNEMIYTCTIDTPLSPMVASGENDALTGLWFIGQKYYPVQTAHWMDAPEHPVFKALRRYLAQYFAGQAPVHDIRLAPNGSPFRQKVWNILLEIPLGQVVTYGQIAGRIAQTEGLKSLSAQAVGGAVGHNPISILIPCHRVVGFNGSLTGYAGGIEKKAALLRIENVQRKKEKRSEMG